MSWSRIEEQWKQWRRKADELATIVDKHEAHIGKLQKKYGVAKHEAKQQIDEYVNYTFTTAGIVHGLPPELSFARLQFVKRL